MDRSANIMRLCVEELGIIVETTGGYASSINGTAETPRRTFKLSIRSMLIGANMADPAWCFVGQYSSLMVVLVGDESIFSEE